MMNCSVQFTFGFEESALNARTVIKIIPITPIAKKMHEGKLSNPASIAKPFKFFLSTMSAVIRTINPSSDYKQCAVKKTAYSNCRQSEKYNRNQVGKFYYGYLYAFTMCKFCYAHCRCLAYEFCQLMLTDL